MDGAHGAGRARGIGAQIGRRDPIAFDRVTARRATAAATREQADAGIEIDDLGRRGDRVDDVGDERPKQYRLPWKNAEHVPAQRAPVLADRAVVSTTCRIAASTLRPEADARDR